MATLLLRTYTTSRDTIIRHDNFGNERVDVRFDRATCADCFKRPQCTRSKAGPREIMLRPQAQHQLLQTRRQQKATDTWRAHLRQTRRHRGDAIARDSGFWAATMSLYRSIKDPVSTCYDRSRDERGSNR
ncbi:hypothetical protein G6L79_30955 [Agrobacterium rhizogenes]|nr:hypothetical protein [Rhizobium rhizogenes]